MLNAPAQPIMYPNVHPAVQASKNQQQQNILPTQQPDKKQVLKEQSMAITADICAEYGAITRLNDILVNIANDIKTQNDVEQKKVLEARINTINQMILQREMKINQMEMTKSQIDAQLNA